MPDPAPALCADLRTGLAAELGPELSAEEVAELFDVVARERQTVQELEACWERLRASYRARDRIQHLSPSEIEAAMRRTRRLLDEEGRP